MDPAPPETFLMERYWPGAGRADVATAEEHLRWAAGELMREEVRIRVVSSMWIPADDVVMTLFEAGEEDDVREAGRRGGYPFDRIQRVDVVTAVRRRWRDDEERV